MTGRITHLLLLATLWGLPFVGAADGFRAIQEQLNANTLNMPFDAGDPAQLDAALDAAVAKGVEPPLKPGPHWRAGYTCRNLRPWYNEYFNCRLYYRRYGCYYCR
jgi:hypothetical protein